MSYHHPRHWRHDPSDRWRAVGVDNQALAPWCEAVAAGRVPSIQIRTAGGQVFTVRRLERAYLREAVAFAPSAFAAAIDQTRKSVAQTITDRDGPLYCRYPGCTQRLGHPGPHW